MSGRILLVADAGKPTGFERVARATGTALVELGYEVIQRGIGYHPDRLGVEPYPYEVRVAGQKVSDPLAVTRLPDWLEEDCPDAVLFVQDLWNQVNYLGYVPRGLPTVGYFPVDAPNMKWSYAIGAAALTEAVPYTTFGAVEVARGVQAAVDILVQGMRRHGRSLEEPGRYLTLPKEEMTLHMRTEFLASRQNVAGYDPVAHGIDTATFYPMDRVACRQAWGFPQDAFILLNVNTNQFRKRQDITIRAFAAHLQQVPNAFLVLHCMGQSDREGWDLAQLAQLYGVQDRLICTHWREPEMTDERLRQLYNAADVQLNTGGGEGWGLTTCEGALCGIPQLVPDWSATREIWEGAAVLLPILDYRFEPRYLNTAHAIVDVHGTALHLNTLARHALYRERVGMDCRSRALTLPTWADMGRHLASRVTRALAAPTPQPRSLQEVLAARQPLPPSELRPVHFR